MSEPTRRWTPDHHHEDGSITVTMKRCCNGCHRELGDVTDQEIDAGIAGLPLPDVRDECGCEPNGGYIGVGGDDTVPAMLSPGYVLPERLAGPLADRINHQSSPVVSLSVCRAALIDAAARAQYESDRAHHPSVAVRGWGHLNADERDIYLPDAALVLDAVLPLICERIASEIEAERDEDDDWDTAMAWLKSAVIARSFAGEAS